MNNNKYVEFNVKPKNEKREQIIMNILKVIKFIAIILAFMMFYLAFTFNNYFWILFVSLGLFALLLHYFQVKLYSFYDVIFIDGDVTITKVVNNVKRKRILSFTYKNVEMIGKMGGETYLKYLKDKTVKKLYLTDDITVNDVCIYINGTTDYLIIMPYNDRFLASILRFLTKQKFEKTFFN